MVPTGRETFSLKEISHSSDSLMDQFAEETKAKIMLAEWWVESYPDFLGAHLSCPPLKLKPHDKTLRPGIREPSDLFICSS